MSFDEELKLKYYRKSLKTIIFFYSINIKMIYSGDL
jgi:hypothetical protein